MDYKQALDLVKTARNGWRKPIANNTYLVLDTNSNDIAVQLHSTDIVTFKPDGAIVLDAGGWHTHTTKARMNQYLDRYTVSSERGSWIVMAKDMTYYFDDGITIQPDGSIDAQPVFASKLEKLTGRKIETLAATIKALKELSMDELVKSWKRFKRDRTLIATYCREDFLPLTLGDEGYGEEWREVVTHRLRKEEV